MWMFSPTSLISFFRWTLLATTLCVSLFVNRWLGFGLLISLILWELCAYFLAPHFLIRRLKKKRLRNQNILKSMDHSLWKDYRGETEWLELSADWPTLLMIRGQSTQLLVSPTLGEKLNSEERVILLNWSYFVHQRGLDKISLRLILLTLPLTFFFKILDKTGVRPGTNNKMGWEKGAHTLLHPLMKPFFKEHQLILNELSKKHNPDSINKLRDKLNHLMMAHNSTPPTDTSYLSIDPESLFNQQSYYYFTQPPSQKKGWSS